MSVQSAFDKLNARRIALVVRKLEGGGLDAQHKVELAAVTERCDAVVNALFPLPSLEEVGKRLGLAGLEDREDCQLEMLFGEDNQSPPEDAGAAGEGSCGRPSDTHCAFDPALGRRAGPS